MRSVERPLVEVYFTSQYASSRSSSCTSESHRAPQLASQSHDRSQELEAASLRVTELEDKAFERGRTYEHVTQRKNKKLLSEYTMDELVAARDELAPMLRQQQRADWYEVRHQSLVFSNEIARRLAK